MSLILGNFTSKKFVLFVLNKNGGNFMTNNKERLDFNVSTWVSLDVKKRLYEIAELEKTTVSKIARRFLEIGVNEYEEVKDNGN